MRKLLTNILGIFLLTGCTTLSGNFTQMSAALNQQMADDTTNELIRLYPPAQSRFILAQPIDDAYGNRLVSDLRLKGYALVEGNGINSAGGKNLQYVVDKVQVNAKDAGYRLTLRIDQHALSRIYQIAANGKLMAAGPWGWQE